jgi:hypothetical protein
MKQFDPYDSRPPRPSNLGQRLIAALVIALVVYLIWIAHAGKYDVQVNRIALWLHRQFDALRH